MAKSYVYYNVNYPDREQGYHPHCFSCAIRIVAHDYRAAVNLETTDFESTKCRKCGVFIKDSIEI